MTSSSAVQYHRSPAPWMEKFCGATLRIIALIDDPGLCGGFLYPTNVRNWPRLCENESIFLTDGTAHHNDFCWRLGDAMHSHIGIRNK